MMYIAPLKDLGLRFIQSSRELACLICTQDEQIKRLAAEDSRSVATWSEASSEKMRNSFKVLEEQRRRNSPLKFCKRV